MNNYNQRMKQIDAFLKEFRSYPQKISVVNVYNKLILLGISDNDIKENSLLLTNLNYVDQLQHEKYENFSYACNFTPHRIADYLVKYLHPKYGFTTYNTNLKIGSSSSKIEEHDWNTSEDQAIKINIPLNSSHLKEGSRKILEFLKNNDIEFSSSISKCYRFDNMIVRVYNPKDADTLSNFIASDNYLQEGICPPNPFAIQNKGLAFTSDNKLSYNQIVSAIIASYHNDKIKRNKINEINIQDFYNYTVNLYNKLISLSKKGHIKQINKLANESDFFNTITSFMIPQYEVYALDNCMEIVELFLRTFDPNFQYKDFIEFYKKSKGYEFSEEPFQRNQSEQPTKITSDNANLNFELLIKILVTMTKKYGSHSAFFCLEEYLKTGDGQYLTNTNNIRQIVLQSNFRDAINGKLKNSGMSLSDFLNQLGITEEYIASKCGGISATQRHKK